MDCMEPLTFEDARKARGLELATTKKIVKLTDRFWSVPSQSHNGKYAVDPDAGTCMCPDFETFGLPCKHLYAVQYVRHQLAAPSGTSAVKEILKTTYRQNWSAYNAAQCSEKDTVQVLLKNLCAGVHQPRYRGNGRPSLPLADVIYGATMKVYSGVSGRRASSDIRACADKGFIDENPHYNTILRYLDKSEVTAIYLALIAESASPLVDFESRFAVDATGFATNTYARWFDHKYGRERKSQQWLKLHAIVGVRSNVMTAVTVTGGHRNDSPEFEALVRATGSRFQMTEVSADKAYLSNANLKAVEDMGAVPFIPFKSNSRDAGGDAWMRMRAYFQAHEEDFLDHYHQRSNVESTFSAIKRKFGASVRAKHERAQINEILAKVLCHNLSCLVHEIHEHGIEPKFWMPRAA